MKEFDETTIWTSDQIPMMASYNEGLLISIVFILAIVPPFPLLCDNVLWYTGKMQHSVWVVEMNCHLEVENGNIMDAVPAGVLPKKFSFRRIWQGKGAQTAACKVPTMDLCRLFN